MKRNARVCLVASALALSLIGAAGVSSAEKAARRQQPQPTTTVVTTTTTTMVGVAPLTAHELGDLLEAKLIAMTGSHDAAWILQGMYGGVKSDDIKFAREKMLRVWDWP